MSNMRRSRRHRHGPPFGHAVPMEPGSDPIHLTHHAGTGEHHLVLDPTLINELLTDVSLHDGAHCGDCNQWVPAAQGCIISGTPEDPVPYWAHNDIRDCHESSIS